MPFATGDTDLLYRCNGSPSHAYRLSEAIDGGCPSCAAQGRITDRTAGQNEGSAANEFEKRVQQDI